MFLRSMSFLFYFASICLALCSCEKPDPNPELRDPIHAELEKIIKTTDGEIKAAEKQLEEFREAASKVKPQTGQIKFAQKRVFDTEASLNKLRQKLEFYRISTETRKKYVQKQYRAAFQAKKPWPDPADAAEYSAQQALEASSRTWNAKARVEAAKAPPPKPSGGGGH